MITLAWWLMTAFVVCSILASIAGTCMGWGDDDI